MYKLVCSATAASSSGFAIICLKRQWQSAYAEQHAIKLLYSWQASLFLAWFKETYDKYYISMPYILWLCVCLSAQCV